MSTRSRRTSTYIDLHLKTPHVTRCRPLGVPLRNLPVARHRQQGTSLAVVLPIVPRKSHVRAFHTGFKDRICFDRFATKLGENSFSPSDIQLSSAVTNASPKRPRPPTPRAIILIHRRSASANVKTARVVDTERNSRTAKLTSVETTAAALPTSVSSSGLVHRRRKMQVANLTSEAS